MDDAIILFVSLAGILSFTIILGFTMIDILSTPYQTNNLYYSVILNILILLFLFPIISILS